MKTKYNWVSVPRWVQYIAKNKSRKLYGYSERPSFVGDGWSADILRCFAGLSRTAYLDMADSSNGWEDSLEQRPPLDDTRAHIEAIIKNVLQDENTDCGHEVLCSIIASRCAKEILKALNLCE